MKKSTSLRRLVENEVVFRRANEKVQKRLKDLNIQAKADGHTPLVRNDDLPLHFFCECSDENCRERIVLKSSKYESLHKNRRQFIVLPNHQAPIVERVIIKQPEYAVVEKSITPPENVSGLKPTPLKNV